MSLLLSSALSGLIGTGVMTLFLYLPRVWQGLYYDTLGALGSILLDEVGARSRIVGAVLLLVGGVVFAFFYGWYARMFIGGPFLAPNYTVPGSSAVNVFYPLFGLVAGFCQGIFITLITTFVIVDHHPVERYRQFYPLILSFIIGHSVYGMTVMTLQSLFLS